MIGTAALLALLSGVLLVSPSSASTGAVPVRTRLDVRDRAVPFVPGELIVGFRTHAARTSADAVHRSVGGRVRQRFSALGIDVVKLPPGLSVANAARAYRADPAVASAEPNYLRFPTEHLTEPSDARFDDQWALHNEKQSHPLSLNPWGFTRRAGIAGADVKALRAWRKVTSPKETVVAVIDTGVDVTHPDLDDNLWVNQGEAGDGQATDNLDNDGNGCVDDLFGCDFTVSGTPDGSDLLAEDLEGWEHGTHVAGIIAAERNDQSADPSLGAVGVCPHCKIMVLKFMSDSPHDPGVLAGDVVAEIAAIEYAIENGADIINGSFGSIGGWTASERRAFARAGTAGILSILAAGNSNGDNDLLASYDLDGDGYPDSAGPAFPASYSLSTILAVGASNDRDQLGHGTGCRLHYGGPGWPCTFTNWGHESVDVVAPGVDILSTVPAAGYDVFDGTSMAAPMVAGVAGLVHSQTPGYTPGKIKNAIMNSVDRPSPLGNLYAFSRPGLDGPIVGSWTRTNGRVNAYRAIGASTANATARTDGNINGARSIDRTRRDSLDWPEDSNDVFAKKLIKDATYRVRLDGPDNARLFDFDLIVMEPRTQEIWQFQEACDEGWNAAGCKFLRWPRDADSNTTVQFVAPTTGVYYIHLANFSPSADERAYTVTVRRL